MNNSMPKISVLLPTYNQAQFIEETLESVLIQNYLNIEIVIGDDGSTDGTREILLRYKDNYPNLIKLVLSEKNEGITANCNKILNECTGDFIALFAGDDLWAPNKLNMQMDWFRNNPDAALCFTKSEVFENSTGRVIATKPDLPLPSQDDVIEYAFAITACGPSFLIARWALPQNGFDKRLSFVSDWLFWIDVLKKGKAGCLEEVLVKYRRHTQNTSNNFELIFAEHIMTLCIIENKYPDLVASVGQKRIDKLLHQLDYYLTGGDESIKVNLLKKTLRMNSAKSLFSTIKEEVAYRIKRRLRSE